MTREALRSSTERRFPLLMFLMEHVSQPSTADDRTSNILPRAFQLDKGPLTAVDDKAYVLQQCKFIGSRFRLKSCTCTCIRRSQLGNRDTLVKNEFWLRLGRGLSSMGVIASYTTKLNGEYYPSWAKTPAKLP